MRIVSALAVAMGLMGVATPTLAADLVYHHRHDGPDLLEASDGRPYFVLLAECSGFYGALSNKAANEAERQAYLDQGVETFMLAVHQVVSDRPIDQAAAVDLLDPYVQRARVLGEASLDQVPADVSTEMLTPRIAMTSTCLAVRQQYDAAT